MTFYQSIHTLDCGEGWFHWFVLQKTNLIRVWRIAMDWSYNYALHLRSEIVSWNVSHIFDGFHTFVRLTP